MSELGGQGAAPVEFGGWPSGPGGSAPLRNVAFDLDAYVRRAQLGTCFVCAVVDDQPGYDLEQVVYEDARHIAFLDRHPTMPGKVLVAPKAHIEHVVRDLDEDAYLQLMSVVRRVALAVEQVVSSERTYLLSLGSQQGNSHLHWHIAALPPDIPYEQQQYHALMTENGVIPWTINDATNLARRLRTALAE
ncbi:HIT family protein [Acrocarpospora phusangensis]|nr:HIT family protein [Acrocarpospora phusangensis]